jgi:glucose/mannose-6-phosphate isomerase
MVYNNKEKMGRVREIVVCGMGGSALPGYALDSWALVEKIPIKVSIWDSYGLPAFLDKDAVIFCVSYSGNTEETLSSFILAKKGGYKNIFSLTSGGKLEALSKKYGIKVLKVPPDIPPRLAIGYMTGRVLEALYKQKVISSYSKDADFGPIKYKISSKIKTIAKRLENSIPLVYTSREWYALGHIWKIAFNETAKIPAFSYHFPEANHNEMEGFGQNPTSINKYFRAIFIEFSNDDLRIKKRFNLSKKVWKKAGVEVIHMKFLKKDFWKTFFDNISLGYSIAKAIADIRKIDPNKTELIENFKRWMLLN